MAELGVILSGSEGAVTLETLSDRELRDQYLPLRYQIYHQEFGYSLESVKSPADFWDRFDAASVSLGLFVAPRRLIGAVRVIEAASTSGLPSGANIPPLSNQKPDERVGELSRGMVAKPYRGQGIFTVLFVSGIILAQERGLSRVFASEADRPAYREFLGQLDFQVVNSDFLFSDGVIAPPVRSACFCLDLTRLRASYVDDLNGRREELFKSACLGIREVQEQASHST